MTTTASPYIHLGIKMGCCMLGLNEHHLRYTQGAVECLEHKEAGEFHKSAAAMAAAIYAAAGRDESLGHHLFLKAASALEWDPGWNTLIESVYDALGGSLMEKAAAPGGVWEKVKGMLGGVVGKGAPMAMDAWLTGAAATSLAGSGLGALYWKANRDVNLDEEKTEEMRAKSKEYNRIAAEIDQALRLKGVPV